MLTFSAALAVVPLATTDPAAAHPKTKTVQRCAYDPFAGNQCWTETVSVTHYHTPVQRNLKRCPAGTTGTHPNCYPTPPANTGGTDTGTDTDEPQNPCEPWPSCNQSSDPKPETTTACIFARGPGHKHGDHGCHATTPGHTHGETDDGSEDGSGGGTTGSAYSFANALGKILNWFDDNKDTLADPPQALTDAVESQAVRDAAKAAARSGLDFMENNLHLFGTLTIAQQKALARLFLDAPPEAQLGISIVACGAVYALYAPAGVACEAALGLSVIHDDKVRPWLRPFGDILLPEDDDSGGDDGGQTGNGQQQSESDAPPADPNQPDNTDYTYDDGAYARKMCTEHSVEYFCSLVGANEQDDSQ